LIEGCRRKMPPMTRNRVTRSNAVALGLLTLRYRKFEWISGEKRCGSLDPQSSIWEEGARGKRERHRTATMLEECLGRNSFSRPRPRPPVLRFLFCFRRPSAVLPASSLARENRQQRHPAAASAAAAALVALLRTKQEKQPTKNSLQTLKEKNRLLSGLRRRQGLFSLLPGHPRPRRRPRRLGIHGRGGRPPRRGAPGPRPGRADGRLAGREAVLGSVPAPRGRDGRDGAADQDRRRELGPRRRGLLLPAARDDAGDSGEAAEARQDRGPERGLQAAGRRDVQGVVRVEKTKSSFLDEMMLFFLFVREREKPEPQNSTLRGGKNKKNKKGTAASTRPRSSRRRPSMASPSSRASPSRRRASSPTPAATRPRCSSRSCRSSRPGSSSRTAS